MDENSSLFHKLKTYAQGDAAPLHMPGHKRSTEGIEFLEELGAKYDITEIYGFDELHNPEGILAEAMEKAARLWNSEHSFFLVNGSTCGILAAVRAAARLGGSKKIIMARNCHKSVYNAAELCALEPVYLIPPCLEDFGFCGSIIPQDVEMSVRDNPGAPVILTSPTYEGIISNIAEISIICHMYGSPLIVDEAHGAHLDLSSQFTGGALRAGADIVVQSVHKTLTGLTQTGLLHLNSSLIPMEDIAAELAIFETSSPSYLLMASIDGTRELIENRGTELFRRWRQALDFFDARCAILQNLKLPGHSVLFSCQPTAIGAGYSSKKLDCPLVYGFDRSKLVISCEGTDITGAELMSRLRNRFAIECEMASCGYVVAMTGLLDAPASLERLADALLTLDKEIRKTAPRKPFVFPKAPPRRMSVAQACAEEGRTVYLKDAKGKISAEYIWAYPPGVPLVVPGEELTEELLRGITIHKEAGVSLHSSSGGMPKTIYTANPAAAK